MSTSATVVRESTGRIVGLSWHRFPPEFKDVTPLFSPVPRRDSSVQEAREFVMPAATSSPAVQIEREAHARGFAEGERQANAAAGARYDAAVARLLAAARELQDLRAGVLARSENDVLNLSIAIARRILGRAIDQDPTLVSQMARHALARLAEPVVATIQMRPEALDALPEAERAAFATGPVRFEAAPQLPPGACLVQTPRGTIDISLDAQLKEILDGLTPDDARS